MNQPADAVPESFDVIVIGSGMGGLACASLLAQLRERRVLVLERHFRIGGYTHTFARPCGARWDMGLHYVGRLEEGGQLRSLMDAVTRRAVRWNALPSPFETYHFPDFTISQPVGRAAWIDALTTKWPAERRAIERYFNAVDAAYHWFTGKLRHRIDSNVRRTLSRTDALALGTTNQALDSCGVRSLELRAVLAAQWSDYGVPPAYSAFVAHAMVVHHFLDGGWYPEGGAAGIAAAASAAISDAGGHCLVRHDVEEVIVESGRAVGVRVRCGPQRSRQLREFRAPVIVSDAGAAITYGRLLRGVSAHRVACERALVERLQTSVSAVQLFLALRESSSSLGVRGENHWCFDGCDHDALHARRDMLLDGRPAQAFVSFASLNDPTQRGTTAQIMAPVSRNAFERWTQSSWKRRGTEYESCKAKIADSMLAFVEHRLPGLTSLVDYSELATPLTFEHFSGHRNGAIYGLQGVPERFATDRLTVATPIPGLLLTGSDVSISGVAGALMGGAMTAGHLLGSAGFDRLLASVRSVGARQRAVYS